MNIAKKLFAVCVAVVMLACPVLAEDVIMLESTLVYTSEDRFWVNIPNTIVVGEQSYVEAMDVNIAPGKTIYVDLANNNDYVEITSSVDPSSILLVYFDTAEGSRVSVMNPTLATFAYGESGTKQFSTCIENTTDAVAGEYTGSIMFNIHCE